MKLPHIARVGGSCPPIATIQIFFYTIIRCIDLFAYASELALHGSFHEPNKTLTTLVDNDYRQLNSGYMLIYMEWHLLINDWAHKVRVIDACDGIIGYPGVSLFSIT